MIAAHQIFFGGKKWRNPYVTDGLFTFWDGEWNAGGGVHDPQPTFLIDAVNGWVVSPENFKNSQNYEFSAHDKFISLRDCNLLFDTASATALTSLFSQQYLTWEFAAIRRSGGNRIYTFSDISSNSYGSWQNSWYQFFLKLGAQASDTARCSTMGTARFLVDTYVTYTAVFNGGHIEVYANGVKTNDFNVEQQQQQPLALLTGSRYLYDNFTTSADIYCVRVYNRTLTASEIAANYAVDVARFGLT